MAVRMCDLQLRQQLRFCSVLIAQAPCAGAAAIPAVSQLDGQDIFAASQKRCNVVGLILYAPAVIGNAGRKDNVPCPLSVQLRFVQTASRDI